MKLKILTFLIMCSFVALTFAQSDLPEKPQSWVNDYADVLSASEERDLEGMLSGLEKRSSNQIFVGIFQKLPENSYLEDFTVKLYDKWRPGLADQDNGILIVVFIDDRKMRIEVGYGLEDVVTDAQSGTIINEYMAPNFRKGDYYAGLKSALTVLIPAAEGKYKIPLKTTKSPKGKKSPFSWIITLFIIFIVMSRLLGRRRSAAYGSRRRGAGYVGPFFFGGGGGSSFGGGGGGFSGGFGGMSGGGGASGSW
jgi:uncharacterized protein